MPLNYKITVTNQKGQTISSTGLKNASKGSIMEVFSAGVHVNQTYMATITISHHLFHNITLNKNNMGEKNCEFIEPHDCYHYNSCSFNLQDYCEASLRGYQFGISECDVVCVPNVSNPHSYSMQIKEERKTFDW